MRRGLLLLIAAFAAIGCAATIGSGPTPAAGTPTLLAPSPATRATCLGPDAEWGHIPEPVRSYALAWNERDAAARAERLTAAWSADGAYVDPAMDDPVVGRDALVELIDGFLSDRPGQYFEFREWTAGDLHHERARIQWRLCGADGTTLLEGEDILELSPSGRIVRVTGFFPVP
jgi:hypothetical protein